jgi:hypothetical protein
LPASAVLSTRKPATATREAALVTRVADHLLIRRSFDEFAALAP